MKESRKNSLDFELGFNYVISSQNTTITLSDDYHCNSQIVDDIEVEFSNSMFSILTRRLSLKPNIEDFRHFVVTSQNLDIIDINVVRGCSPTNETQKIVSEICVIILFEEIDAVDTSFLAKLTYQYEGVSFVKTEITPKLRKNKNSISLTLQNENNYHINNVKIMFKFNFSLKPIENLTIISPENYEIISKNNKILQIDYSFFEIRNKEEWLLYIEFNEIVRGCTDSKLYLYRNESNEINYMAAVWIVLLIFSFLIMIVFYCGEITNLKKKKK